MLKNRVFRNASWIIVCRIVQSALSFIISMLTARYLGPSNYGVISYAASIVAFVAPIAQLGLGNIQVQELVKDQENEGAIVGTTLGLSVVSSFFCMIGVIAFSCIANSTERETIIVCALYSIILMFQSAELFQYWFQAKLISKYASLASLFAFALVTLYKIILLLKGTNVYWFAVANTIDYAIITFELYILYKHLGGDKLSFSFVIAKRMLGNSKYYIISNMMIAIFSQTDRIMLKLMIDSAATGIYSAASSCACIANFFYTAIIDSFRPVIFAKHERSRKEFEYNVSMLYSLVIYISIAESLVVTLFANMIIEIIYGQYYMAAVQPLRIMIWFTTFSFIGSVRNIWILAENKQRWLWVINLSGAFTNIILNLILIPVYGIVGASIASLATQFFSNVIVSYVISDIRPNTRLMLHGCNPIFIREVIRKTIR